MPNFTPGPWEWVEGLPIISRQWNGKDWPVATVANRDLGWHENRNCEAQESGANAQLIAAAPTMYEALQAAEVMMRALLVSTPCAVSTNDMGKFRNVNSVGVLKEVQEALAKATGKQTQS